MNRNAIATALGVSLPTVDAWQREGMPCLRRGSRGKDFDFDAADCIAWRDTRELARGARGEKLLDLAKFWVLSHDGPPEMATAAEFIAVFGGWSLDDVRELAQWSMPWDQTGDVAGWQISMGLALRWIASTLATLDNNGAAIKPEQLPVVLRGLRIRAGIDRRGTVYDSDASRVAYVREQAASRRDDEPGDLDLAQERAALARAQRESADLRNAERRGELVPRDGFRSGVITLATTISGAFQSLPSRLAQEVAPETSAARCQEIIEREVHKILHDLADLGDDLVARTAQTAKQ